MIRIQQITVPAQGGTPVPVSVKGKTYFDLSVVPAVRMAVIDPSGFDEGRYIRFGGFTSPVVFDFGVGCQVFITSNDVATGLITIMTDMQSGDPVGVV